MTLVIINRLLLNDSYDALILNYG